jgi:hypothetical protein
LKKNWRRTGEELKRDNGRRGIEELRIDELELPGGQIKRLTTCYICTIL